jgi:hypothetical protein
VLYGPTLQRLLAEADRALSLLALADPELGQPLGAVVASWMWPRGSLLAPPPIDPARLLSAATLAEAGVDLGAPAVIVPGDRVILLRFGLRDRPAFEAWLDRTAGKDRRRVPIGGESASVLAEDTDRPVTCLARQTFAACQIGVSPGDRAVADLEAMLVGGEGSYGRLAGVRESHLRLPHDAGLFVYVSPLPAAKAISRAFAERELLRVRFSDEPAKRAAAAGIDELDASLAAWSRAVDGAAAAISIGAASSARIELALTGAGSRNLEEVAAAGSADPAIERWTKTPALLSVLLHARPAFVSRLAEDLFDVDLPPRALSGTVGLLTLGVDSECPAAKASAGDVAWTLMLPSALSVGLGPSAADDVRGLLALRFGQTDLEKGAPIAGLATGSPYEIHVLDRMIVVGTGPGSGAAALRRLTAVASGPAASGPSAFLAATMHPRAVEAALAAIAVGREHRAELRTLEAMRHRLEPLLERFEAVAIDARVDRGDRRVAIHIGME